MTMTYSVVQEHKMNAAREHNILKLLCCTVRLAFRQCPQTIIPLRISECACQIIFVATTKQNQESKFVNWDFGTRCLSMVVVVA